MCIALVITLCPAPRNIIQLSGVMTCSSNASAQKMEVVGFQVSGPPRLVETLFQRTTIILIKTSKKLNKQ